MSTHLYRWFILHAIIILCVACEGETPTQSTSSDHISPEEMEAGEGMGSVGGVAGELVPMGGVMGSTDPVSGTDSTELEAGHTPTSEPVIIDIPMIPKEEGVANFILVPNEARQDSEILETYVVNASLQMIVAEGYPTRYKVTLASPIFASACAQTEGIIELQSVTGDTVDVTLLDETSFLIEGITPSVGVIDAIGIFRPTASDLERCEDTIRPMVDIQLEIRFDIPARIPTALVPARRPVSCQETAETLLMATSSLRTLIPLEMLDEDGASVSARNAEVTHPVALTVTAPSGTTLDDPEQGLRGIKLGSKAGPLMIQAPFGAPVEYTVIDTQDVTAWSVAWSIAGFAGGGIAALEDGMTYDAPWGRTSNRILPVLTDHFASGDSLLCTHQVDPSLFIVTSETPENCSVDDVAHESSEIGGQSMGHSISVNADGECRLRLSAPDFNGGQGLESTISVTLNQVDMMIRL